MEPSTARKLWMAIEPVHAFVYFVPESRQAYDALGLEPISHYFASRSAPMGAVPHSVVAATFYNFSPGLVKRAMRDAWATAAPAVVLEARHAGVRSGLERLTEGRGLESATAELTELASAPRPNSKSPAGRCSAVMPRCRSRTNHSWRCGIS